MYLEDILGLRDEKIDDMQTLLEKVMEDGKCIGTNPSIEEIRNEFKNNFSFLDEKYKSLRDTETYPVKLSSRLLDLQKKL